MSSLKGEAEREPGVQNVYYTLTPAEGRGKARLGRKALNCDTGLTETPSTLARSGGIGAEGSIACHGYPR